MRQREERGKTNPATRWEEGRATYILENKKILKRKKGGQGKAQLLSKPDQQGKGSCLSSCLNSANDGIDKGKNTLRLDIREGTYRGSGEEQEKPNQTEGKPQALKRQRGGNGKGMGTKVRSDRRKLKLFLVKRGTETPLPKRKT